MQYIMLIKVLSNKESRLFFAIQMRLLIYD